MTRGWESGRRVRSDMDVGGLIDVEVDEWNLIAFACLYLFREKEMTGEMTVNKCKGQILRGED